MSQKPEKFQIPYLFDFCVFDIDVCLLDAIVVDDGRPFDEEPVGSRLQVDGHLLHRSHHDVNLFTLFTFFQIFRKCLSLCFEKWHFLFFFSLLGRGLTTHTGPIDN